MSQSAGELRLNPRARNDRGNGASMSGIDGKVIVIAVGEIIVRPAAQD